MDNTAIAADHLANNLKRVREVRGLTQAQLATLAAVPRSTLANLETGGGNPTLSVLMQLSAALQLSLQELLSPPRGLIEKVAARELATVKRGKGVRIDKLLPHPVPGMEIDRLVLGALAKMRGAPHRPGTHEYLYCAHGALTIWVAGERVDLDTGDVASFPGDQRHSYQNRGRSQAIGFSVVVLAPISARR